MRRASWLSTLLVTFCIIPLWLGPVEPSDFNALEEESIYNRLKDSMVEVHFFWQVPTEEKLSQITESSEKSVYFQLSDMEESIETLGIVLNDQGEILVLDPGFTLDFLKKILVKTRQGDVLPGALHALLLRTPGLIIKVEKGSERLTPLNYLAEEPSETESLHGAGFSRSDDHWSMRIWKLSQGYAYWKREPARRTMVQDYLNVAFPGFSLGRTSYASPCLVLNEAGQVVGIMCAAETDWQEQLAVWKIKNILDGERLNYAQWRNDEKTLRERLRGGFFQVRIEYRQERAEPEYTGPFAELYEMFREKETLEDFIGYGLALNARTLFLPVALPREKVHRIESVWIQVGEARKEGEFLGTFREFRGFVVQLKEGELPLAGAQYTTGEQLELHLPYVALRVKHSFGAQHQELGLFRYLGKQKTYLNQFKLLANTQLQQGDFIATTQGKLIGFYTAQRYKDDDLKQYSLKDFARSWRLGIDQEVLEGSFSFSQMEQVFKQPERHFDPRYVPLTKEQEREKVWLGVEYDPITEELAKRLKVEQATKDGEIGLVVTRVYPGSASERLGVSTGDILLSLRLPDAPRPLELIPEEDEFEEFNIIYEKFPKFFDVLGWQPPKPRPWRSRNNYLTRFLKLIGEGEKVILSYYSDGKVDAQELTIEKAPPDYDSIAKYKDEQLGLTLKSLTYEVRMALKIPAEEQGVVVAKVEPGTPASVADIEQYEVISQIEGEKVKDTEDFEEKIAQAREANSDKVSLVIYSMGTKRVVDLILPSP